MSYLTALPVAYVNAWWKVSGTAYPGKLHADLQLWNGSAWVLTSSYGPIAANGSYSRYWKPTRAGVFRLRVLVHGVRLDNTPWSRELTLTVKQLPQQLSSVTGTVLSYTTALPRVASSRSGSFGPFTVQP